MILNIIRIISKEINNTLLFYNVFYAVTCYLLRVGPLSQAGLENVSCRQAQPANRFGPQVQRSRGRENGRFTGKIHPKGGSGTAPIRNLVIGVAPDGHDGLAGAIHYRHSALIAPDRGQERGVGNLGGLLIYRYSGRESIARGTFSLAGASPATPRRS